jgi:hypothetical protein
MRPNRLYDTVAPFAVTDTTGGEFRKRSWYARVGGSSGKEPLVEIEKVAEVPSGETV